MILLMLGLLSMASLQAQFAKPLKKKNLSERNIFSIGVTGSFAANDMLYSALSKSMRSLFLAPIYGIVAEWNTMQQFSVGVDVSYATRGANKAFATEFLTSYSTTTFVRVNYDILLNGMELRIPVTYYFGEGEHLRPYVYVAPRVSLWMDGQIRWERTYDNGSYAPVVYESEVNKATILPFDLSAMAGLGLCSRFRLGRAQFFLKLDLGYGISALSNFSQVEVDEEVVFQGWGDIAHEELGKRYLQNAEVRLTLMASLHKFLADACAFEQRMRKPK